jgi:type IV secretory pathway TrbF-like protein
VTPSSATAYVAWRERRRSERNVGDWVRCSTTISMTKVPPRDPKEVQDNPLSIRITDYNYGCRDPRDEPRHQKAAAE